MLEVYDREVSVDQATRLMRARKKNKRSWTKHFQYLFAVASSANFPDGSVLQYICDGAATEVKRVMQTRLDPLRTEHLKQALEMTHFAAIFEHATSANMVSVGRRPSGTRIIFGVWTL